MALDNDTRGWIMTCVSGIACVVGASIICVDLLVQCIPSKRQFRIQDSNAFLSASLSLSFGVMLFSSLFSMLPSSKKYLTIGGLSPTAAAYILIGSFLGGVIGIQIVSRLLHHYIPSHVVDCDHTHDDQEEDEESEHDHEGDHPYLHQNGHIYDSEETPLLPGDGRSHSYHPDGMVRQKLLETAQRPDAPLLSSRVSRRPSLQNRLTKRVTTFVSGAKASCDEGGPCYGFSDPCGQECLKAISRSPTRPLGRTVSASSRHATLRTFSHPLFVADSLSGLNEESIPPDPGTHEQQQFRGRQNTLSDSPFAHFIRPLTSTNGDIEAGKRTRGISSSSTAMPPNDPSQAHHHHVPSNAFLSIGLQTSIAIALHKLPEGFITFATNHANPKLGFAVFMALFIHNITEGFAMALPLYLALGSRWKAMFWSSLLGGISQPLGAGIAALCFKVAGRTDYTPGEKLYGGMFAVTAGIMASVALQLFSESLGLTHNRNTCIAFAFLGMGILGFSFALTAEQG